MKTKEKDMKISQTSALRGLIQLSVIKTSCTRKMNDLEAVLLRAFR